MDEMKMQFPLNHKCAVTSDSRIFVIGGTFNLTTAYRQTYEIINKNKLIEKSSLGTPRHSFGCIAIKTSVLVIGGYFSIARTLSTCEIYNSIRDEWRTIPNISTARGCMGVCTFNQYVYCFGGSSRLNTAFHNVIERLDTTNIIHDDKEMALDYYNYVLEWQVIQPKFRLDKLKGYNYGCCQMSTDEILIFGGSIPNQKNTYDKRMISRSTIIFNAKTSEIKFYDGDIEEETKFIDYDTEQYCLDENDLFYHNDQICYRNKIYAHGKENFHVFDCITRSWQFVGNYEPSLKYVNSENGKSNT